MAPKRPTPEVLDVWQRWLRAHRQMIDALDEELQAEAGLRLEHYDVLYQLKVATGARLRMSELAGALLITRSSCTRLVTRMEELGLVSRAPDASDRRVVWATLTPEGRAAQRRSSPVHLRGIDRHFASRLSARQVGQLGRALARLLEQ